MTVASKLQVLAAIKAEQYAAIIAKGASVVAADWGAYAAAIAAIPTGGSAIPAVIANTPFEPGDEPTGGTVWYVRPDGAGLKDGTSWDNAFASRAEAVAAASSGDRVYVMEGKYRITAPQVPKVGVSEYYGFPADEPTWANRQPFLTPSRLAAGFTANNFSNTAYVFLDGQVIDGLRVENVDGASGVNCTVSSNFKHCVAYNCSGATNGGGMYLAGTSSATNCTVANCTATNGGGMYLSNSTLATNCTVANCTANIGGGMYLAGTSSATNCTVANCATGNNGGGMYLAGTSTATNCTVMNCTASNGGGMFLNSGTLAANCTVMNCTATNGGGMYLNSSSTATNCTVANCTATNNGGGFYCVQTPRLYSCVSWGDRIYLASANYAYKIYNCASNFPLTGVSGWSNNADIQGFLDLSASPFPFADEGQSPFDGSGAFFRNLPNGEEALAFIESDIIPNVADPHLPAGSPLIGAGYYEAGVTPDTDADGKERPMPPSIGAYEP